MKREKQVAATLYRVRHCAAPYQNGDQNGDQNGQQQLRNVFS
jgi:hypothetical protein